MPLGEGTGSTSAISIKPHRNTFHFILAGSIAAEHAGGGDALSVDLTKTLEVQVNRILREQKLKLTKLKKDNANLRALLESESASKVEPLPGMSVIDP